MSKKKKCDSKLYISAALFEHKHRNMQAARNYLNEGIRIHKNCKKLRLEQFWLEIQFLVDKNLDSSHLVLQKYKETIDHFRYDMELHILFLEKTLQVESINYLQFIVLRDFIDKYQQDYQMWHKVALLCTEGYMLDENILYCVKYTTSCEHRMRNCIKLYEEGLRKLINMGKKRNLNELFTEYLVNQWNSISDKNMAIRCLVNRAMEQAFHKGHFELGGLHKPDYYVYWAEHTNQRRPEILRMAIDRNKDNVDVWVKVLEYHILILEDYKSAKNVFDDGVRALENKSLLLWKTMDLYLQNSGLNLIEQFYEEGANSPYEEINMVYRVEYLKWYTLYSGINSSRELFNKLINLTPENKTLYLTMINCEKLAPIIDVNIIRDLYSLMCFKYGHQENDVRLWADWIQFEFTYGKSPDAEDTYNTALMFVKPELMSILEHEYDLMKEAYNNRTVTIEPVVVEIPDPEE
uniref:U3 small nucleolar RNA-associated protein 6 n=1 Tax=Schizaphis graminum TaxID=13262 RepID=A0A2S2PF83_SCHGA